LLLTKALYELRLDVTALMPSKVDLDRVGKYHGVEVSYLKNSKVIKYKTVNCINQYVIYWIRL